MNEEDILAQGLVVIIAFIIFFSFIIYRSFFSISGICTNGYEKGTDIKTLLKEKNITDKKDIEKCYSTYNIYIEYEEKNKKEEEIYNIEREKRKTDEVKKVNSYYYK